MIRERVVLRRIEHLEQRCRGIALERDAQLVDLIEQEDRILGARLLHALNDPAGHGAHIRPAMPTDVGLVARSTEGNADVGPAHGARDRLRDRRLSDTRRADEQQSRRARGAIILVPGRFLFGLALAKLPHRQKLEHLVFDVLQTVMVLFQNFLGPFQIEGLVGALVPRQLGDGLEVGADDLCFHRLAAGALEPRELAIHFLARRLGEVERIEPRPQVVSVGGLFLLAQFFADRFHLLAQQHFALPLTQLLLHLRLDVFLSVEHRDLPLDVHQHAPQAIFDRQRLEQLLPFGRLDIEMAGDQIRERARIGHALQNLLHDVGRKARLLAELRGPLAHFAMESDKRRILRVERRQVLGFSDGRFEIAVGFCIVDSGTAHLAVEHQLHAAEIALHLADVSNSAGGIQHPRRDLIDILFLRDGEHTSVALLESGLNGSQRRRTACTDRGGDTGKQHGVTQRQDR